MAAPSVDDVAADPVLPGRADVVVVGGGIVGVSTALALAEKGIPTVLCEKGRIGGEQSSRNWGWCRNTGRDLREVPLMAHSARLWQDMNARTGRETGYRRRGILFLCQDAAEAARMEGWQRDAMPHQLGTRFLSGQQVADLLPQSGRRWAAGLYTPSDGQAEPAHAAPAIAEAARARGAGIQTRCAVRGFETTAGRLSAVVTERGPIRCGAVV
ncbi:FAD-binding oxidoreductase, partial [Roseomonas sp. KE0001]|nr:FAD-binding oxidoreductase [Roseomonas sp. KE0001]